MTPDSGGKRTYFGHYGTKECESAYRKWLSHLTEVHIENVPHTSTGTLADLALLYLMDVKKRTSEENYVIIYHALERLWNSLGSDPPSSLSVVKVQRLIEDMANGTYLHGGKVKRYSRTYVNKTLKIIKRFVSWGHLHGHISAESWSRLQVYEGIRRNETKARELPKRLGVPLAIVRASLPQMPKMVGTMVRIQYLCGMRPQDICSIRPVDIDQTGEVWIYCPAEHKNTHRGLGLMKAIPKAAQELLRENWPATSVDYFFSPKASILSVRKVTDRDVLARLGDKYHPSSYYKSVRKAAEKAEVPLWGPNQLRHSIATYLKAKFDQETAQYYLGHTAISTTDIYARRAEEKLKEVANQIEDPFQ